MNKLKCKKKKNIKRRKETNWKIKQKIEKWISKYTFM